MRGRGFGPCSHVTDEPVLNAEPSYWAHGPPVATVNRLALPLATLAH